ncbi:MAG: glycosyltransferase family 2 protein [candidate division Zixibacteria bacterium]|nr:glycosyltransferase family 2 protein [candidate division Zixibacteria bacterium]
MKETVVEISAIVIAYHGMKFLPDCLRTLSDDLSSLSHEIIVVDNGSNDGSVAYVKEHYPDISLVENKTNLGFARAVNIGLEKARGRYLYILNQDLRFPPGTAVSLLERLKADETIGLIGPRYIGFDGKLQKSARSFPSYRHIFYRALFLDRLFPRHRRFADWRMGWFDHETEKFVDQPMGAVMLIPRKVVEEVGLLDEKFPIFFNDVDYCRRLKAAGYRLLYYPGATVEHYAGASVRQKPLKMRIISSLALIRYLKKYARPREYPLVVLCAVILLIGLIPLSIAVLFKKKPT